MLSNPLFRSSRVLFFSLVALMLTGCDRLVILNSKGPIGKEEATLIYISVAAMLIVIIPVFIMTFLFLKRYRDTSHNGDYRPDFVHSTKVEIVIWSVPVMIICFLSYLVWVKTHELDPYKAIASENEPLNIEVISLDWNWLFIYPDHNIAMINELVIPEDVPLSFKLTSDTVMTSMFIPQLGSQMYAMAGMQTQLNLMADEAGTYDGHNVEYSGEGYDTMHFKVLAKTIPDFESWLKDAKQQTTPLDLAAYEKLSKPNTNYPVTLFSPVEPGLFHHVMASYMGWMGDHQAMKDGQHMQENQQHMQHMGHMEMDEKNTTEKGN